MASASPPYATHRDQLLRKRSQTKRRIGVSLTPENEFIELNRTFHELSEHAGKRDDVDLSQVFHIKSNLTWNDVLKIPRTVILSEAGSGKTQEIRRVAERLREEGKAAFFLRLELIPDDFDIAFEVGTYEQFKAWIASGETGWMLLDSVDEARLRSPVDFERAVRRLGNLVAVLNIKKVARHWQPPVRQVLPHSIVPIARPLSWRPPS
jgi:hypothetical protein